METEEVIALSIPSDMETTCAETPKVLRLNPDFVDPSTSQFSSTNMVDEVRKLMKTQISRSGKSAVNAASVSTSTSTSTSNSISPSSERPWVCECGKSYVTSSSLGKHQRLEECLLNEKAEQKKVKSMAARTENKSQHPTTGATTARLKPLISKARGGSPSTKPPVTTTSISITTGRKRTLTDRFAPADTFKKPKIAGQCVADAACPICHRIFTGDTLEEKLRGLDKHINQKNAHILSEIKTNKFTFKCERCNHYFSTKDHLREHQQLKVKDTVVENEDKKQTAVNKTKKEEISEQLQSEKLKITENKVEHDLEQPQTSEKKSIRKMKEESVDFVWNIQNIKGISKRFQGLYEKCIGQKFVDKDESNSNKFRIHGIARQGEKTELYFQYYNISRFKRAPPVNSNDFEYSLCSDMIGSSSPWVEWEDEKFLLTMGGKKSKSKINLT
jgi:hypothetical protein